VFLQTVNIQPDTKYKEVERKSVKPNPSGKISPNSCNAESHTALKYTVASTNIEKNGACKYYFFSQGKQTTSQ